MRKETRSAVAWVVLDFLLRQGGSFAIVVILARLLTPEDFGIIALFMFFVAIANVFSDAGFSLALIQKQDVDHVDESTIFWFNLMASTVVALIMLFIAPWVSSFYRIDVLQNLIYLAAGVVLCSSLGAIHRSLLTKALNFKLQMLVGLVAMVVSALAAIYMASHGYGVWALAVQALISAAITVVLLWMVHSWRPLLVFNIASLKTMAGFSGFMFAAQILQVLYDKGYSLLLGKFFGVSQLGVFDRADKTQRMVSESMTGVIAKVAFPLYSKYSDNKESLRVIVRKTTRIMMLVITPIMLGLLFVADLLIPFVFGEQWNPAVPIFQVLCIVGLLYPLQSVNVTALQAQGRADLNFRLSLAKKAIGILLIVFCSYWGVLGVAWAMVLQGCISLFINGYYSSKLLSYGILTQLKDCTSSFVISLVMLLSIFLFNHLVSMDPVLILLSDMFLGSLIYFGVNALFGLKSFKEAIEFINGREVRV